METQHKRDKHISEQGGPYHSTRSPCQFLILAEKWNPMWILSRTQTTRRTSALKLESTLVQNIVKSAWAKVEGRDASNCSDACHVLSSGQDSLFSSCAGPSWSISPRGWAHTSQLRSPHRANPSTSPIRWLNRTTVQRTGTTGSTRRVFDFVIFSLRMQ